MTVMDLMRRIVNGSRCSALEAADVLAKCEARSHNMAEIAATECKSACAQRELPPELAAISALPAMS